VLRVDLILCSALPLCSYPESVCHSFPTLTPSRLTQGLLRSALAQEAELAQHLEGYPYATSGNKYDTQSFYYHSSAYNTSLRSRYSAKEMEVTDIEGAAPDLTTGNDAFVYEFYVSF
jgi:hypothetical protein